MPLKREATGKLFPVSDRAQDVLQALLGAARRAGVELRHPCKVAAIRTDGARAASRYSRSRRARPSTTPTPAATRWCWRPGAGASPRPDPTGPATPWPRASGLPLTPRIFPALVPLRLPDGHPVCAPFRPGHRRPPDRRLRHRSAPRPRSPGPCSAPTRASRGRRSSTSAVTGRRPWTTIPASGVLVNWLPDVGRRGPRPPIAAAWRPADSTGPGAAPARSTGRRAVRPRRRRSGRVRRDADARRAQAPRRPHAPPGGCRSSARADSRWPR